MANIGDIYSFNINGNELTLRDATLTEIVEEIITAIGENNGDIGTRINDLNDRAFDALIKISSNNYSEISSIQDGIYKLQYVTITGESPNTTETLNNSAILIQQGTSQYLYKDGSLSTRVKSNNTWEDWINNDEILATAIVDLDNRISNLEENGTGSGSSGGTAGVTSFNGQTGAVTYTAPVTSVNGQTGAVVISGGNGEGGDINVIESITFNGNAVSVDSNKNAAITYTPPVTSVNGQTGAVTVTSGDANVIEAITFNGNNVSVNNKTAAITYSAPVTSVNGQTGAVTVTGLPTVTSSNNGKILMVVNGQWAMVSPSIIYSGNGVPSNINGNNGDIYIQV